MQEQNKQLMQMLLEKQHPAEKSTKKVEGSVKSGGVKDFKSLHPREFSGSESPVIAKEWFDHVHTLLVAANIPDAIKVSVVQIQFTGIARA